jgi:hypothetical protein
MSHAVRRLPLIVTLFVLVAACVTLSVQALWADEATAKCEWNYKGDFCEDLNCDPIGFCAGSSPVECTCIIG